MEWKKFRTELAIRLEDAPDPHKSLTSTAGFDEMLTTIMTALKETIEEKVPETKPRRSPNGGT